MAMDYDWMYRVTTSGDDGMPRYQFCHDADQARLATRQAEASKDGSVSVERRFMEGGAWQTVSMDAL
ncbi:hypothetical protein ACGF5F_32765 [Streptomyces sp. NPDC047821]|uniref:hypothetical protein n=1 Tax=Streptomyces sp. NPDC047821 TaxID=3365488 RepID=UPI0037225030